MSPSKIMIIRHAEKPSQDGTIGGVDESGVSDRESLSVRGWQRAGALVRYFSSNGSGTMDQRLAEPQHLFASKIDPAANSTSRRSLQTLTPIAQTLGVSINASFDKGDEPAMAREILTKTGVVLIAWEHGRILDIASTIVTDQTILPASWPDDRFDVVWVLDSHSTGWKFDQVPQHLLAGDDHVENA